MGFVVKTSGDGGSHVIEITSVEPKGESQAGEGAAQGVDKRPEDRADAEAGAAGGDVTGKVKGKTLSLEGVPAKAVSPTAKNDGDADVGKKGKGKSSPTISPAPARRRRTSRPSRRTPRVMQAIQALAKSVQESHAAVTKSVSDLSAQVESVDRFGEEDRCGPERDRVQRGGRRQDRRSRSATAGTAASRSWIRLIRVGARKRAARAERATQIGAVSCTKE